MKSACTITLTAEERGALVRWSRGRSTPARQVLRAKIVLLAADGLMNMEIAAQLGTAKKDRFAVAHSLRYVAIGRHRARCTTLRAEAGHSASRRAQDSR